MGTMKNLRGCAALLAVFFLASCSTAPKAPSGIFDARNNAAQFVQLGAKALREGAPASAETFYTEAYRLYTAADDSEGRIRALDGIGRLPGAVASDEWNKAARIAAESGDAKLIALASLLIAELDLLNGTEAGAKKALSASLSGAELLSRSPKDEARALRLAGTAAKNLGDYRAALSYLEGAARLDEKEKAFAEYASDRYIAASVHSKAGDYAAARAALLEALENDRRSENSIGIGEDYFALAIITEKFGDSAIAAAYFNRAAEVFRAARFEDRAVEAERRRDALTDKTR